MAGINRALVENRHLAKARDSANKPCIFLSHISIDKAAATEIGNYITKLGDIDIYLDINDPDLQDSVKNNDATGITRFVERGLTSSTHIMCLISADTARSWWVPYELGFAKNAGRHLSTLKLKGDISLPAFLEITEIIPGTKTLNDYLTRVRRGLGKTGDTRPLTETLTVHTAPSHPLDPYLNWKE
jgi:MTH538 TIR-like domain (DUF1863)